MRIEEFMGVVTIDADTGRIAFHDQLGRVVHEEIDETWIDDEDPGEAEWTAEDFFNHFPEYERYLFIDLER